MGMRCQFRLDNLFNTLTVNLLHCREASSDRNGATLT